MNKKLILTITLGIIIGAAIGFIIRYFRNVNIAPFIGALGGALYAKYLDKKLNK